MPFRTIGLISFFIFSAALFKACGGSAEDTSKEEREYKTELEHGDFVGRWTTPSPYDTYERAELNVRAEDDGIAGVLRYARVDISDDSSSGSERFFWNGEKQGNTAVIDMRNDNGDAAGRARLALMEEKLAVQFLEPAPGLPEIFVLQRAEEE